MMLKIFSGANGYYIADEGKDGSHHQPQDAGATLGYDKPAAHRELLLRAGKTENAADPVEILTRYAIHHPDRWVEYAGLRRYAHTRPGGGWRICSTQAEVDEFTAGPARGKGEWREDRSRSIGPSSSAKTGYE